jgi:hypothetical protein
MSNNAGTNTVGARRRGRLVNEISLENVDRTGKRSLLSIGTAPRGAAHERNGGLTPPADDWRPARRTPRALRAAASVAPGVRERQGQFRRQCIGGRNRGHWKRAAIGTANETVTVSCGTPAPSVVRYDEIGFGDDASQARKWARVHLAITQRGDERARGDHHANTSTGLLSRHGEMLRFVRSGELIVDRERRRRRDARWSEGR